MPSTIHLKSGSWYEIADSYDTVYKLWVRAFEDEAGSVAVFDRLDGGLPRPKLVVNMREVEHVLEVRR
jgi:hypothetical protein